MNRNRTQRQGKTISLALLALIGLFLFSSCVAASSHPSGSWRVIGIYNEDHSIMTAGFLNEQYVATGGVLGHMAYSSDGAQTWLQTNSLADCRYGMDIASPQVIWSCGGATDVRKSVDGGVSWNMRSIPETAHKIATIDTYLPGEGYLLDQNGVLFFTKDDGQHWREAGHLPVGELRRSMSAYQLAAMCFSDAEHGLVVVSPGDYGGEGQVIGFHTSDGGETWTSEAVPVSPGSVDLSREGGFLTVITAYDQLTLLSYTE